MDGLKKLEDKLSARKAKNAQYMHSDSHALADELSVKLNDKSHFGYYLKMATTHDHSILRSILGQVLESKQVDNPGKLFTYLLKKHDTESKATK